LNPNRKVFFTGMAFVLAMVMIACSCSSLVPVPGAATPAGNPLPGLAGTWHNPDTKDVFEFAWQNGQYEVVSCSWEGTSYSITSQSWSGSALNWSYYDSDLSLTVTLTTISLSGDNLEINWSLSDGTSGSSTLVRGGV
jgi:hypothetical protein